jgi:TRAP-type C4-dicarboxylate transport system substrate-binding protein
VTVTTNGVPTTVAVGATSTVPVVTVANLCTLTKQYVKSSAKYAALTAKQKQAIDASADAACARIQSITPKLTATQKAALIASYKKTVQALVAPGWLTQTQATTLTELANSL